MGRKKKEAPKLMVGIKPGLLDPKHHKAMGPAVWPFLWLLQIPMMDGDDGLLQSPSGNPFSRAKLVRGMQVALGYSKAMAYRLFNRLVAGGYLEQCKDGTWEITNYENFRMFFARRKAERRAASGRLLNETGSLPNETKSLPDETKLGSNGAHKNIRSNKNMREGDKTSPLPKKEKGIRSSKKRDPRLNHPALKIYRSLAQLSTPAAVRDDMIRAYQDLGEARWQWAVKEWIGRGYNPRNIAGMIEVAHHGFRDQRGGKHGQDRELRYQEELKQV